jgi:hypothetical protein
MIIRSQNGIANSILEKQTQNVDRIIEEHLYMTERHS